MSRFSVKQLMDHLNRALNEKWGYAWGGRGRIYDAAEGDYLFRMFNTPKYNRHYFFVTQWRRWPNRIVVDCSGLLRCFCNIITNSQGFYTRCVTKGPISAFPKIPGYLVFRYSAREKKIVHVGVYVGNGMVIESMDSATGVVKTRFSTKSWTHWGQPNFIDFDEITVPDKPPSAPPAQFTLKRLLSVSAPLKRGDDVRALQKALVSLGFSVGKSGADGVYGNDTRNAVRRFQQANRLTVDGIVGRHTAGALGWKWAG